MTNRERLNGLSTEKFMAAIKSIASTPGFEYVDWEGYMASESPRIPYKGEPGRFRSHAQDLDEVCGNGEMVPCLILGETVMFGEPYVRVLSGSGQYLAVPACQAERLAAGKGREAGNA